jgi:hypothetical protein
MRLKETLSRGEIIESFFGGFAFTADIRLTVPRETTPENFFSVSRGTIVQRKTAA